MKSVCGIDYSWTNHWQRESLWESYWNYRARPKKYCYFFSYISIEYKVERCAVEHIYKPLVCLTHFYRYYFLFCFYIESISIFVTRILRMKTECVHFSLEICCLLCGKRANFSNKMKCICIKYCLNEMCICSNFFLSLSLSCSPPIQFDFFLHLMHWINTFQFGFRPKQNARLWSC